MSGPAKKKRATTRWRAAVWQRTYRGVFLWIEEAFIASPRWSWDTDGDDSGRAKTRIGAMRAAERAVDAALEKEAR